MDKVSTIAVCLCLLFLGSSVLARPIEAVSQPTTLYTIGRSDAAQAQATTQEPEEDDEDDDEDEDDDDDDEG